MSWLHMTPRPIELPETPTISREDADLIWRADIPLRTWNQLTDEQRQQIRWNTPATKDTP